MKSGESGSPEGVLGKRARSGTAANQSRIAPENEAAKRHKIPKGASQFCTKSDRLVFRLLPA